METINTRVLIIDDEEIVRDNIEDILIPKRSYTNELISSASSILFDDEIPQPEPILTPANNSSIPVFTVDKAVSGMEGLEKIKQAIAEGKPYAVIFLDMRMPGWDGLETAVYIKEADAKAEIIIITAFSDKSIEEIMSKVGQNVGYHCKPYASEEIIQLATKGVNDYHKLRNLEQLITVISNLNVSQTQLNLLLQNILDQLAMYIGSDMAVLGKLLTSNNYQQLYSIGSVGIVERKINIDRLTGIIANTNLKENEEVVQVDELVFIKIEDYYIFAALDNNQHLKTEKLYLLKLFVQSAAKAIKNAQLHEVIAREEKLSIVGKALSMLMHDLRIPIKNIPLLTESLREEGFTSPWLDMVDECGDQASEIFDDFLDFLRDTPLNFEKVSINQLISDGIALAHHLPEMANITVDENLQPDLFVKGDASKLKRVVMNLVHNAAEALNNLKVASPVIKITAVKSDKTVVIKVKDNGLGIPETILKNLFDAFVTVGKRNGTGLGLAIVKQFVEAHKGTVTVANDNGAEFTITLPAA
ncbi:hybrid sensor histidine kinase/response regulator [Mucilaginibacter glaciei]|uniref:histidine kinase n=1 Tax=Mucilaginibacter glaciei TaxID=2772109 RepID=A0A926NQ41_9SPHI|nr:hybrid sensor histidine kinase/response regulator [Mucilaginibacter glaciei]MBD1395256.1 hybrid sensor histidine kinase/response regulator [Mucilaginibacter glaciei]